jgi:Lar family restriction alleviation protein
MPTDQNQNAAELLPCPFCGGEAERETFTGANGVSYWVECRDCGVRIDIELTAAEADVAWNTRSDSPKLAALRTRNEELMKIMCPTCHYFLKVNDAME